MKKKSGDLFECPHCKQQQEEEIDHYVIPGRIGKASRAFERCFNCDKHFSVIKLKNKEFLVERGEKNEETSVSATFVSSNL